MLGRGTPALVLAAATNHLEALRELLDKGSDKESQPQLAAAKSSLLCSVAHCSVPGQDAKDSTKGSGAEL